MALPLFASAKRNKIEQSRHLPCDEPGVWVQHLGLYVGNLIIANMLHGEPTPKTIAKTTKHKAKWPSMSEIIVHGVVIIEDRADSHTNHKVAMKSMNLAHRLVEKDYQARYGSTEVRLPQHRGQLDFLLYGLVPAMEQSSTPQHMDPDLRHIALFPRSVYTRGDTRILEDVQQIDDEEIGLSWRVLAERQ